MYIDRCCFRVPNSIIDSQNTLDRRKKLQRSLTPHLDCCPHSIFEASDKQIPKWRPIQAFIALTDTLNKNEGGFEACRGLHAEFDSWNADRRWSMSIVESDKSLPPPCISEFTPIRPKEDNNILRKLDHVPCRAGGMTVDTYFLLLYNTYLQIYRFFFLCISQFLLPFVRPDLVCWDYRIPHGNSRRNNSETVREAVYVGLLPDVTRNRKYAKNQLEQFQNEILPTDQWHGSTSHQVCSHFVFSQLGRKLMMIDSW